MLNRSLRTTTFRLKKFFKITSLPFGARKKIDFTCLICYILKINMCMICAAVRRALDNAFKKRTGCRTITQGTTGGIP